MVETLPEDIPDELGHEWRVLHLFDLPGVRCPTDTMPPNQRRLAENDAFMEYCKQQNTWMMCPPGDKETIDFTLHDMVILSTEEEVEEEVEIEEGESGFKKGKWIDLMEDLAEDMVKIIIQEHNNKHLQIDLNQLDKKMSGLHPLMLKEEMIQRDIRQYKHLPQLPLLPWKKDYLPTGVVKTLQEKG